MADKMLRIAGRGEDGLAKAIKADETGNIGVSLTHSKSKVIDSKAVTLAKGDVISVEGDASNSVAKTAYIFSDKNGFADIEVKIGGVWRSMLGLHVFSDTFNEPDDTPLSSDWSVTTHANAATTSIAKVVSNKMQFAVVPTTSYAQFAATVDKKINPANETIINFELDEVALPAADANKDMFVGLSPVKAVAGGTRPSALADWVSFFQILNQSVISNGVTYPITPMSNSKYTIVFSTNSMKLYRNQVLIVESTLALTHTEYYLFFQLSTHQSAGTFAVTLDNVSVKNAGIQETEVIANKLWVKTTADVVANNMRVTFVNSVENDNTKVLVELQGQS